VLDDTARRAYQTRLAELDAERAEAAEWNDPERLARAEAEIDALTEQLAGAYGLRGRSRTMADPSERVRKAVTNRIRDSLDRIAQETPSPRPPPHELRAHRDVLLLHPRTPHQLGTLTAG
jgi:hypothetical protein